MTDPLDSLLLDATQIDRSQIAQVLQDILGIDKGSGSIILKPGFNGLSQRQKILAYLLGKKSAVLLEVSSEETAKATEIPDATQIPGGTVRPKLRKLLADRLISQASTGEYYITQPQVARIIQELTNKEAKDD